MDDQTQNQNKSVKYRQPLPFSERNEYNFILAKDGRPKSVALLGAASYEVLINSSTVVADKSLFIRNILEDQMPRTATLLFALPSGSGKTTLLTMLRDFVTEKGPLDGRIFEEKFEKGKKIAIMANEYEQFRQIHYGMYPTLFIDLNIESPVDATEVEEKINELISGMFSDEFNYLENWLEMKANENRSNKLKLTKFQEFGGQKRMESKLWDQALKLLTKTMVEYSKENGRSKGATKPIIIVDNSDGPIVNFGFNAAGSSSQKSHKELEKIITIVQKFMDCLSKANDNKRFLVVSGNYQFAMEKLYAKKITMERDLLVATTLQPDILLNFGFNESEFMELCMAYRFDPNNMEEAKGHFNGLVIGSTPTYFTWSTMAMLNNHSEGGDLFIVHSIESPFFQHFHPLFKKQQIIEKMEQILGGNAIMKEQFKPFTSANLLKLHSHVDMEIDSPSQPVNLFVRFLIATGYLTRQGNLLVIPNLEKGAIFTELMEEHYYEHKFKFEIHYANMITNEMSRIALGKVDDGDELKDALKEMLAQMNEDEKNEAFLQTVVGFAALRIRYWSKIALDKVMGGSGQNTRARPNVAFSSRTKRFAFFAELKWKRTETVEGAFRQIIDREYLTKCKSLISPQIDVAIAVAIVGKPSASGKGQEQIEVVIEKLKNEKPKKSPIDFMKYFEEKLSEKYQP